MPGNNGDTSSEAVRSPDEADTLKDEELAHAQAHCPHCLAPIDPTQYYCHACGESVGQLTGYIPFVNIRFQTNFLARLWRRFWFSKEAGYGEKVVTAILVLTRYQIMLVGLPFAVWAKVRSRRTGKEAVKE